MCLSSLLHTVFKKPLPMRGYYIDSMCMLWLFWSNLANKAISDVKCSHFCCTHISWILFQNRIWSLNLPPTSELKVSESYYDPSPPNPMHWWVFLVFPCRFECGFLCIPRDQNNVSSHFIINIHFNEFMIPL